jgi:hypothetical protein|tara:strand:+ start:261 stop:434 length:174 start_codon:yes stop_codon:yes gene_type:complete
MGDERGSRAVGREAKRYASDNTREPTPAAARKAEIGKTEEQQAPINSVALIHFKTED